MPTNKPRIKLTLTPSQLRAVEVYAEDKNQSVSQVIRDALTEYIPQFIDDMPSHGGKRAKNDNA